MARPGRGSRAERTLTAHRRIIVRRVIAILAVVCAPAAWPISASAQAPPTATQTAAPTATATATATATPLPGCFSQIRALCPTCIVAGFELHLTLAGGQLGGRIAYQITDAAGKRLERLGDCEIELRAHDLDDLPAAAKTALRDWVRRRIRAAEGLAP